MMARSPGPLLPSLGPAPRSRAPRARHVLWCAVGAVSALLWLLTLRLQLACVAAGAHWWWHS